MRDGDDDDEDEYEDEDEDEDEDAQSKDGCGQGRRRVRIKPRISELSRISSLRYCIYANTVQKFEPTANPALRDP